MITPSINSNKTRSEAGWYDSILRISSNISSIIMESFANLKSINSFYANNRKNSDKLSNTYVRCGLSNGACWKHKKRSNNLFFSCL